MILRTIISIPVAYATLTGVFFATLFLTAFVWTPLQQSAELFWAEQRYDVFPTDQLILFQIVWLIANTAAGFVTRLIARRMTTVCIVAALMFAYFAWNHWWALWGALPDWYNIIIVLPVIPMVLVGNVLAKRFTDARQARTT